VKTYLLGFAVVAGSILSACGRSPDSQFYTLNPISHQQKPLKVCKRLSLGIHEIQGPSYLSKPEVMIQQFAQAVKLEEYHRWVDNLKNNTRTVIAANLTTLLPGAVFVSEPWDSKFKPKYQLQIDILQFVVDIQGNSQLAVDYLLYNDSQRKLNGTLVYHQKVPQAKVANLVASMNANLNQFTRDLAKVLAQFC
jgi:uncharacterized lipoprotein YmbA